MAILGDGGSEPVPFSSQPLRLSAAAAIVLYLEIVLGAQLRHWQADDGPLWFVLWVWLKLIVAGLLAAGIVALPIAVLRKVPRDPLLRRRAQLLGLLFFTQVGLGLLTWITKYGFPGWFRQYFWTFQFTVVEHGLWQVTAVTLHVAVGSLTLAAALSLTLWLNLTARRGLSRFSRREGDRDRKTRT